ncbi:glycosyltransferase [Actinoplanes utahensis]|uniref:glycosyltransferase n=1 Tax=Actinoplanes utahensis TaxID=1869 RepID=UPI003617BB83
MHLPLSDETGLPASEAAELRALECRTLRLAATVIATSTPAARRVEELHGLSGVHAVPPGVDPAPQAVPSATGHRLLNVASLTHRKGQDLLLDALLMLPAELPWTCTVAGAGRLPNSTATPPATLRRTTSSPAPATSAHTTSSSAPGTSAHTTSGTAPATSTHATSSSAPGTSTDPTSSTAPATSAHTTSSTAPATSTHTTSSTAPATSAHTTSSTASGASAHTTSSTASPAPTRTASTAGAARTAAADATAVSPDDIARSWTIDHRPQGRTVQDPLEERGSVRFVGALSGAALDDAYANADLFVLPSRAETYGMVVTEALARGLPVVAADVGGVPEALGAAPGGGIPGRLIPPDDPHALAAALRDWLTDAGLRERWRRHALARRAELTGWDETARLLREVLEGLAA